MSQFSQCRPFSHFTRDSVTTFIDSVKAEGVKTLNVWSQAASTILPLTGIWCLCVKDFLFREILAAGVGIYLFGMVFFGLMALERRKIVQTKELIQLEDENKKILTLDAYEPHSFLDLPHPKGKEEEADAQKKKSAFPTHRIYRDSRILALNHSAGLICICSNYGEIDSQRLVQKLNGISSWITRGGLNQHKEQEEQDEDWGPDDTGDFDEVWT